MITLTAKINLLSGDNKDISLNYSNASKNNISSEISSVIGVKTEAKNPFILGKSKLGDGATFSSGVNYFIGRISSIAIKDEQSKLDNLTIEFDTINNRHPNRIRIDGIEYIDDDAIFTVANLTPSSNHTIEILDWNTEGFPIVITGIYTSITIEIDRRNILSLESSIFDRADLKLPSFGIISNTGNIEFNDTNGEIRDYAEKLLLAKGSKCEIRLNNTLIEGASEVIGTFETNEWDYDNDKRLVSVSLKDDLEEWQDINVEGLDLQTEKSFNWLYKYLWGITTANGNYNMLSINKLDENTQAVLNNTYIQYPLLESGSLWQQWTKLCQVCQLHIYKNNDGVIVCRYNGGN